MCRAHRAANKAYRDNYDLTFGNKCDCGKSVGGVGLCAVCGRYMMIDGDEGVCKSCRHVSLVSSGERAHGDFH